MPPLQLAASALSIIYIYLASKNKAIAFLFGAIGCAIWAYEDFININLKFDGVLQLFYVGIAVYGMYKWTKKNEGKELKIRTLPVAYHLLILVLGLGLSFILSNLSMNFFETNLPFLDATTTSFSIIATILLTLRYIDNWVYWLIIDPIYIYIYLKVEAPVFALMMVIYAVMAAVGLYNWNLIRKREIST